MKLLQTKQVHDKFWAYIDQCNDEIGGLGYVRLDGDTWTWYDIFLIEQEVSSASVEYTEAGMASAIERAAQDEVLGADDHAWLIWHSHVNMEAYWSGTDVKDQIHKFRDLSRLPCLFSVVGNKKREYQARLDIWDHWLVPSITFDKVELHTIADNTLREEVQSEMDALVSKRTWSPATKKGPTGGYGMGGWQDLDADDEERVKGKDGTWRSESQEHELTVEDVLTSDWWAGIDWTDDDEAGRAIEVINTVGLDISTLLDSETELFHLMTGREAIEEVDGEVVL